MSGLILAFNRENPREWLSGNIQSPHPVTVTLRGEDGEVGVSLALLAADSGLVSSMLLTHDGREKQITLVGVSVEIIGFYIKVIRSGELHLDEDRLSKKDEIITELEVLLLMLQSQVKLTVDTSDLVFGDQGAVHSHSEPGGDTWRDRENLEEDKNTSFNLYPDAETYNTYDEPMAEDTAELVIESSALEPRENISVDLEDLCLCGVCEDEGRCGNHFGAYSCMACRLFKRTVIKFCRFNKCLKLGMKRDLVQAGKTLVTPKAEPDDSLKCELCGEVFQDTDAFMRHIDTKHGHQCQVVGCEFFFTHEYFLHLHEAEVHKSREHPDDSMKPAEEKSGLLNSTFISADKSSEQEEAITLKTGRQKKIKAIVGQRVERLTGDRNEEEDHGLEPLQGEDGQYYVMLEMIQLPDDSASPTQGLPGHNQSSKHPRARGPRHHGDSQS